ncbi:CinA family protein [Desulfovibrio inopinatus]|uniref:CinA family protein n=1 Tax=Desulfovibrio inopinatus TaxID=102109 RepID=UPI0003F520CF|nr:CinA family protein [Desulfovibrio inopinatus]
MITQRELEYTIGLLGDRLVERGLTLSCAESCTGGLAASLLTDISGSSRWFVGGIVAYANQIKTNILGVAESILIEHGAVSSETVLAMAAGVRRTMQADVSFALSGVAGPTGGTPEKPVGTVWIAWDIGERHISDVYHLGGDRQEIKFQSAAHAITRLAELLE